MNDAQVEVAAFERCELILEVLVVKVTQVLPPDRASSDDEKTGRR